MANLEYHAFRKSKTLKNGKTVHRWYYYYTDSTGKKIQKTCGIKVKSRPAAEDFIRTLPPPKVTVTQSGGLYAQPVNNQDLLVEDIAREMFIPGSAHVKRRGQLKKSVTTESLIANRVFMNHIIAMWGGRML